MPVFVGVVAMVRGLGCEKILMFQIELLSFRSLSRLAAEAGTTGPVTQNRTLLAAAFSFDIYIYIFKLYFGSLPSWSLCTFRIIQPKARRSTACQADRKGRKKRGWTKEKRISPFCTTMLTSTKMFSTFVVEQRRWGTCQTCKDEGMERHNWPRKERRLVWVHCIRILSNRPKDWGMREEDRESVTTLLAHGRFLRSERTKWVNEESVSLSEGCRAWVLSSGRSTFSSVVTDEKTQGRERPEAHARRSLLLPCRSLCSLSHVFRSTRSPRSLTRKRRKEVAEWWFLL